MEIDRKRAKAQYEAKKNRKRSTGDGKDAGHKKALKSGGSSSNGNLKAEDRSSNRSKGGKTGSRAGKAAGARKGHVSRRRKSK
jgi:hypothetical protein